MLKKIYTYLKDNDLKLREYFVPGMWLNKNDTESVSQDFNEFYCGRFEEILKNDKGMNYHESLSKIRREHHGIGGDWSYHSVVYNAFPRFTAAFDHDESGDLEDFTSNNTVFRKTGTFLKMIAMLPYIQSLGVNVLHLMPVTKTSSVPGRGNLSSPYAIKNPYELDENLAETAVPFSVDEQFQALAEACHMLDIRLVLEFVLRTASLDSDWVHEHPDWFYWIDAERKNEYKSPEFTEDELIKIRQIPSGAGTFIAPNEDYQSLFHEPPTADNIQTENGIYKVQSNGKTLTVPGAFADWPPDDSQPPWEDVTYLKLYNDENSEQNFNYIAYDTIRYYHPDLAKKENRNQPLWDALTGIIPHYQKKFGIDGIMLDMGHSLPPELMEDVIREARNVDADFGFWEENFEIRQQSRWTGFNATLGFEWKFREHEEAIRQMLITARKSLPLPFLGTPETHNTPRVTHENIKKQYWVMNSFLTSCIPFIHSGYELCEEHPVNTGLNFTEKQLEFYTDFRLPLFNKGSLDWCSEENMIEFIRKISLLRKKHENWIATGDERTLTIHYPQNRFGKVIAFERHDAYQPWKSILIIMNTNMETSENFFLNIHGTYNNSYTDYLSGKLHFFDEHWLAAELKRGQIMIFELHKLL